MNKLIATSLLAVGLGVAGVASADTLGSYSPAQTQFEQDQQAQVTRVSDNEHQGLTRAQVYQELIQARKDGTIEQFKGR